MSIFGGQGYGGFGGNRGRMGCGTLVGIAIIIFGVIRYYSSTQVNPTTGEKQRVALTEAQESALACKRRRRWRRRWAAWLIRRSRCARP